LKADFKCGKKSQLEKLVFIFPYAVDNFDKKTIISFANSMLFPTFAVRKKI